MSHYCKHGKDNSSGQCVNCTIEQCTERIIEKMEAVGKSFACATKPVVEYGKTFEGLSWGKGGWVMFMAVAIISCAVFGLIIAVLIKYMEGAY